MTAEPADRPAWLLEVVRGGRADAEPDDLVWERLDKYRQNKDSGMRATKSLHNCTTILALDPRWDGKIRYNGFARMIEVHGQSLTDAIAAEVVLWIHDHYSFEPGTDMVQTALLVVSKRFRYHPVRDWLNGLSWDGCKRIENLLRGYFCADDTDLNREIGKRWMISAVARAMDPGCKVDTCLILHGPQGLLKSTAYRVLAGDDWFSDTPVTMGTKDGMEQIQGVWIYELGELDSIKKSEASSVKAFISALVDRFRPSYGRNAEAFPRQCVFVGSTNEPEFLSDPTGSRRFWPVHVEHVYLDELKRDREQLWAEAVACWRSGEKWWLDKEREEALRSSSDLFTQKDPWTEAVQEYLKGKFGFVSTTDILFDGIKLEVKDSKRGDQMRVAGIMQYLGWEKTRDGSRGARGWSKRDPTSPGDPTSMDRL